MRRAEVLRNRPQARRTREKRGCVTPGPVLWCPPGKRSHRNYVHPKVGKPITIAGALGDDAKRYQVHAVQSAVEESKS
jgi:hypothetical protein